MQRLGGSLRRSGRKPSPLQKCKNPGWRLWRLPRQWHWKRVQYRGPTSKLSSKSAASPAQVIPFVDVGFRLDLPLAKKARGRGLGQPLIGVGLALSMACGAVAMLGPPPNWRFAVEQAIGVVASAVSAFKVPETIALQTARGEQPSSMDGHDSVLPMAVTPSGASRSQESGYGSAAAQLYSKGDAAGLGVLAKGATRP